jgi:hypothetical protein
LLGPDGTQPDRKYVRGLQQLSVIHRPSFIRHTFLPRIAPVTEEDGYGYEEAFFASFVALCLISTVLQADDEQIAAGAASCFSRADQQSSRAPKMMYTWSAPSNGQIEMRN